MKTSQAIRALTALAQETRLEAFRLLVRQGDEGMAAGDIAERLGVPAPTLSFHLRQLVEAGLCVNQREGRSIRYRLVQDGIRDLLGFLTEDCCEGRPELCLPDTEERTCASGSTASAAWVGSRCAPPSTARTSTSSRSTSRRPKRTRSRS